MTKKAFEKVEDIPKETVTPETETVKEPDGLPPEPETAPKDTGSKGKPYQKKKKPAPPGTAINPMTGDPYPPGPPGCNHG